MKIIPVIDLLQGQVVHAVRGQRAHYQPLHSGLCTDSDPCNIVQSLLGLYPFNTLYIADLDAIQGNTGNEDIIQKLHQKFPDLAFWLDAGKTTKIELSTTQTPSFMHVIGSETGITIDLLHELTIAVPETVLSLDFKAGVFSGDAEILQRPEVWPQKIIIMNLARVGSATGPDMELLKNIKLLSKGNDIYMAGGIRNTGDLRMLHDHGVSGVLIATALHTGAITRQELYEFK